MPHAQSNGQMTTSTQSPSSSPTPPQSSTAKLDIIAQSADGKNAVTTTGNDTSNEPKKQDMDKSKIHVLFCLYHGRDGFESQHFDETATLEEVELALRKKFNIGPERRTQLWLEGTLVYMSKPADEPSSTVDNSNVGKSFERILDQLIHNYIPENMGSKNEASKDNGEGQLQSSDASANQSENINLNHNNIPPPTPPPMPNSSAANTASVSKSLSDITSSSSSSIVTRQQEANSTSSQLPIALPDSTTPSTPKSKSVLSSISANSSTAKNNIAPSDTGKKTLADLGLYVDAIATLEVMRPDGTWPSSKTGIGAVQTRRTFSPGLCGLSNMGNTCFMNAALQCLSNTPPLTDYILREKYYDDINLNNPLGMHGEIARTYAELIQVMWSGYYSTFLPREFKCAVSRFAPQFTGFAQQDCQELMAFLLDGLHEDLNRIKNKPYIEVKSDDEQRPDEEVAKESWALYKKRNDSIVVDIFHALLKSTLVCPECQLVSVTFDPFCYLSLPLPVRREKQVTVIVMPAPDKIDESRIKTALEVLDPEDVKTILQYGGRISSFDGSVEKFAGYANPKHMVKKAKLSVPRSGQVSELCEQIVKIFNEFESSYDGSSSKKLQAKPLVAERLIVAELAVGRITKIYEPSEHYNSVSDDIVVVERASNYVLPLYLKEAYDSSVISKLLFLHVPDLEYETLYKSITTNLSNLTTDSEDELKQWFRLRPPLELEATESKMECDDDNNHQTGGEEDETSKLVVGADDIDIDDDGWNAEQQVTNGKSEPTEKTTISKTNQLFDLNVVNSFGSHSFEQLGPNRKGCDYSSKLYLGATFLPDVSSSVQFKHNRKPTNQTMERFWSKSEPKPNLQLKDCINQFTNAERLGADDPWYCPKCKKHQQAIKKFDIWSLPKVLIIHLKRFSFSRSWRDKIDTFVEFPIDGLDMSDYVHNPEQKKQRQIYNLIGVANHFGGLGGGHYTAYAKNDHNKEWYHFDDSQVLKTKPADKVITRNAYVLFYQLQGENEPESCQEFDVNTVREADLPS